jgi:2-desacetyl-2-hydroxyethyl bacteriochlorophyllide A dehydrogenase
VLAVVKESPTVGLVVKQVNSPRPGPGDVLVRPFSCGICGSDLSKFRWREHQSNNVTLPMVLGHEFAGEVVELGPEVSGVRVGDRVAVEPFISCGHCYLCRLGEQRLCKSHVNLGSHRDGGLAELVSVPATNIIPIGPDMTATEGAMLEPLAVGVHAAWRSGIQPGESVCVVGPGPIGLLTLAVMRLRGAGPAVIAGTPADQGRLELAASMGADATFDVSRDGWTEQARALCGESPGFDVVVEAAGAPAALLDAFDLVRPGGRVVIAGSFDDVTPIKPYSMIKNDEVTVIGSKGRTRSDWLRAISLVQSGAVDVTRIVDTRVSLADALKGFDAAMNGGATKVLIEVTPT